MTRPGLWSRWVELWHAPRRRHARPRRPGARLVLEELEQRLPPAILALTPLTSDGFTATTAPDNVLVFRRGAFTFTGPSAITIADTDAGALPVQATLSVARGRFAVNGAPSNVNVMGNGTGQLVIAGTSAAVSAALQGLVYRAPANYVGRELLTLSTSDAAASSTLTTGVHIIDPAPVINPKAAQTGVTFVARPDHTFSGTLARFFTAARGDRLTFLRVGAAPPGGQLTLESDGVFHFKPSRTFPGTVRFQVAAFDGFARSKPVTVILTTGAPHVIPPRLALFLPGMVTATGGRAALPAQIASTDLTQDATFSINADAGQFQANTTGVKEVLGLDKLTLSGPIDSINTALRTLSLVLVDQHEVIKASAMAVDHSTTCTASATVEF